MVVAPSTVVAGVQGSPVTLLENAMPGSDFAKSHLVGYHVLPERFTVTLADDGQGWGEWLAVALKDKAANSPE